MYITLEQIEKSFSACRNLQPPPILFWASLPPDKRIFNREEAIDRLFLENVHILHVVYTYTISNRKPSSYHS